YSRAAQTYTPQHATYLRAFAIQAGNAIRNAQLYASERDQRMLSEALRNTAATVNSTLDFDSVLKGILDHVGRVVPHDAANIMLIDGDTIRISHGYGYDELSGVEGRLDNWQINIADIPHLQRMITEQKPLLVSDVAHDPLWVDVDPVDRWIRCSLKVPIRLEEQVVGVLNLDNATPNSFTPQHVDRLQAFADQVATAIRNAQLFTATQQHAITYQEQANRLALINRVSARIAQAITLDDIYEIMTQELQAALDVSFAGLVMYEGTEGRLVMDTHPDHDQHRDRNVSAANNPSLDYMCQTHDVIISADALNDPLFETTWDLLRERGTQSIMVIPLVVENKVIGSLGLDSTTKRHFTSAEAEIAETIVNQAAVAITKAQLLASECDQRMFAETLHNTAEAINRTLDLDQILDRILENIKRLIPHDAANIIFVDGEWLEVMRCTGYETYGTAEAMRNLRVKIDATINWRTIITTKESLIVADTQETPGWMRKVHLNSWIRSTVKAPILLNEDIIGVLSLDSATPHAFDERHAERLQAFAFQAANAIRNARSFAGERDQRQLAEALRDTAKIVNSTLDFDVVLDNILTTISRVVPHDAANIMLIENGVARIARGFGYEKYGADEWARQRNFPVEQTPIWHTMLDTGQPMVVPMTKQDPKWPQMPEEDWIESTVKAPIKIEGKIIGILHLDSTTPGAFNQNHAERLQPFADQAAIAIRNAQLFAAEHRQRTLAETLRDTANAVAGSISLVDAAQRILENVGRVVPHDAANIMVFNWKTNTARTVASRGYVAQGRSGEKHGLEVSLDLAINPEFDRLVIIPDTHNEPDWFTLPGDEWVRSYISAPIRLQDESIGVINLDCKTPDFYTEDHADRLKIFANQAAIAIERAQLFEAVQHHADELEQRVAQRTEELNQQRRQLEAILDAMSEGVLYDTKLDVKYINPALTRLTGYQRDEFINYISVLRRPDQPASDFTAMVNNLYDKVKRRGFWQEDTRLSRKDGSEFDASLTVTPVHDNEERLIGTVTVIRDISQEKALQEQKDRFIANASHELRTPLANIKTRLYLLQHQPEKMAQHLDIINRVSNHMADLVENLLDVSRFDRGVIILNRRNTVLQTIVEDVTAIQQAEAEQKDVAFHVHLHPTPLVVSIDPQRMNQVITNLVANAINYTEAGGSISVELTREQASAVLRVQDTGIGIKPEMVAHVFEPFFRADEKVTIGTGLGLTIVHDIVTLHGGTITVDSVLGAGSTFTVRLDLIE
ncbi:MAG: GAF domain-containing protein, partial [Anaerolineae bacterium]|nr:GAF domain-containing protein [Anaerolineae bacterium]